jgi:uncharacterized C2H2 Zn-finger protein
MDRHSVSKAAPGSVALMEADPEGDYVLYEDAEKELAELRRYDARRLLRCPECGSDDIEIYHSYLGGERAFVCPQCQTESEASSVYGPIFDALLAWHEVTP